MTITLNRSFFSIALAFSCLGIFENVQAQTQSSGPTFRSRSDVHADQDLQRLREELNKATDANGPINPLGSFLQRASEAAENAKAKEAAESTRLEIGQPSKDAEQDLEAERAPRLDAASANRKIAPAPIPKPPRSIGVLPGPRYTIVQQASPQIRVVDEFRPARLVADMEASVRPSLQYPVTLASANLPIVGQGTNVTSNFQDIPYGSTLNTVPLNPGGGFNPSALPPAPTNIMPNNNVMPNNTIPAAVNPQGVFPNDAANQPTLPFIPNPPVNSIPSNTAPLNTMVPSPTYSTPIPNGNPSTVANPPTPYLPAPPSYPTVPMTGPAYNPNQVNPNNSLNNNLNNNGMPNYSRSSPIVNSAPFVSNPPCQFDARYMVSREAYRQCDDPCAPRGSPYAPYASQPGGSPFSYVPQTGMPSIGNGYDSGYRSLIGFGQTLNNAHLGRGIVGQPTAYVEGQPVRNFLRYVFP